MTSINPSIDEVLSELAKRGKDPNYYGTITIALQGAKVAQVREDRVLAIRKPQRNEDNSRHESRR